MKKILLAVLVLFSAAYNVQAQCTAGAAPNPGDGTPSLTTTPTCATANQTTNGIGAGSFQTILGFSASTNYDLYYNTQGAPINCVQARFRNSAGTTTTAWTNINYANAVPGTFTFLQSCAGCDRLEVTTGRSSNWTNTSALLYYRLANPTITSTGTVSPVCFSTSSQNTTLSYTATTNSPTSYSIDWSAAANTAGLTDVGSTALAFSSGSGTVTINVPANVAAATYTGTMTITSANGCTGTLALSLTVNALPAITSNPVNRTACALGAGAATFTVAASGAGLTYAWQVSTDGGTTYSSITAAGTSPVYANWTTTTLSLTNIPTSANTYRYRALVSGTCTPSVFSNGAILTVVNQPAVTNPSNQSVCLGGSSNFSVTTSNGTTQSVQWQYATAATGPYASVVAGPLPVQPILVLLPLR